MCPQYTYSAPCEAARKGRPRDRGLAQSGCVYLKGPTEDITPRFRGLASPPQGEALPGGQGPPSNIHLGSGNERNGKATAFRFKG